MDQRIQPRLDCNEFTQRQASAALWRVHFKLERVWDLVAIYDDILLYL